MVYPDMMCVVFDRKSIITALFDNKIPYNDVVRAFDPESADDGRIGPDAHYSLVRLDIPLSHGNRALDKDYVWVVPADIVFQFFFCRYNNGGTTYTAGGAVESKVIIRCPANRLWLDRQSRTTLKYGKRTYN